MQKCFKHSHTLMLKWNPRRVTGKTEPKEKFGKLNRLKIHISSFPNVNGISPSAIMKKLENGCHFVNVNHTEKFLTQLKNGNRISSENWRCKFFFSEFSIGSFAPITHPRLHFNIYAWLHLKHLCMDIYAWLRVTYV